MDCTSNIHGSRRPNDTHHDGRRRFCHFTFQLSLFFLGFGGLQFFLVLGLNLETIHCGHHGLPLVFVFRLGHSFFGLFPFCPFGDGRHTETRIVGSQKLQRGHLVTHANYLKQLPSVTCLAEFLCLCLPGTLCCFILSIHPWRHSSYQFCCQTSNTTLLQGPSILDTKVRGIAQHGTGRSGESSDIVMKLIRSKQKCKQQRCVWFMVIDSRRFVSRETIPAFLVIFRSKSGIRKHLVGLCHCFELVCRLGITGIFVWMVLSCHQVILPLDFMVIGSGVDLKCFVVKRVDNFTCGRFVEPHFTVQFRFNITKNIIIIVGNTRFGEIGVDPRARCFVPPFALPWRHECFRSGNDPTDNLRHARYRTSYDQSGSTQNSNDGTRRHSDGTSNDTPASRSCRQAHGGSQYGYSNSTYCTRKDVANTTLKALAKVLGFARLHHL
mmetsp:Transcript_27904/g.46150  ORF Transcript_27904/g.46150 Transcript_27904/m.46150 type:complete len:438 (-) Transcript_27904:209-1522(-)